MLATTPRGASRSPRQGVLGLPRLAVLAPAFHEVARQPRLCPGPSLQHWDPSFVEDHFQGVNRSQGTGGAQA